MTEITYHREGDYLLPDLTAPDSPNVGIWGMRRRDYLRKHRSGIYTALLLSGKMNAHLEEIDRAADEMFEFLIEQNAVLEGVTEQLKAEDQMKWVQMMNSILSRAEETVLNDLVYA